MLKRFFVVAFMAILFFMKPSFVSTQASSAYADADSSSNVVSSRSTSPVNYNGSKRICRKNEVTSECIEGGCQAKTCSDLDRDIPCIKMNPNYCTKGCLCKDGYLRAKNGTCVPISSCILNCTRYNEIFVPCPETCPPQTCDSIGKIYHCPLQMNPVNTTNCRPSCRCKPGYLRNKINQCISKDNCQKCTGPNEYYSCYGACDNECATLNEQNETKYPVENEVRNKTCYCEEGYARAKNNTCIPVDKCSEPQCPANEKYVQCPSRSCTPQTCSQLGYSLNCTFLTDDTECKEKPGCVCTDGYVRDNKGVCIPKGECPSCGGDKNAESGCGMNCGRHCFDYFHKGPFGCPAIICSLNGCQCKSGKYYDDAVKKCVDPDDCTPICSKHEVVSNCTNNGCDKRYCSQSNEKKNCLHPSTCKKGCICEKGYLRHPNGTCVPTDECPPVCDENEVYDECIEGNCKAENCSQLGYPLECDQSNSTCSTDRCICKDGYLRADNGTCIPADSCPSCGGDANAKLGCGINCNRHCSNIGQEPQFCIALCKNNSCDCKDGFYLDDNTGKCVLPEDCTPVCGKDEVYSDCTQGQCQPKNCSDLGKPVACPRIIPEYCIKGCLCKDGYARAKNGTCIPKKDCPSCGGDRNAQAGCGMNCNKKCSDIGKEEQPCPDICNGNGCDCRDGFYFDDNTKKCVPRENCTICGGDPNAKPGCSLNCNKHCSNVGKGKEICPRIQCPPNGCECKDGYYLDSNTNKCILPIYCSPSDD